MRFPTIRASAVLATAGAGVLLMGAEPAARPFPPLPVPPVERLPAAPFFARITISGDAKMSGVFEECVDPMARRTRTPTPRPAGAPSSPTGCTSAHTVRPDGSIHGEMSCDRAKGANASFRMVSDGTPNDLRMHTERYASGIGGPKTAVVDSRLVRLGPCPADLKPGQMRRPGGPVLDRSQLDALRGYREGVPQSL